MKTIQNSVSLERFQKEHLQYIFNDIKLLENALTHSSFSKKNGKYYERLEFLGDRILGLVIAEYLYRNFPKEKEGDLAKRLASLVRKETCARVAINLDVGQFIKLSKAEEESGGRQNPSLLADICEALLAAIYIDSDYETVKNFAVHQWQPHINLLKSPPIDNKSALQEWAQKRGYPIPHYHLKESSGPEHEKFFLIEVSIENFPKQTGSGKSKKTAEQIAAKALLTYLKNKN